MKSIRLFAIAAICLALNGNLMAAPKKITVAFYNLENLFDTEDDPTIDDEEFLPTGKNRWDADRYQRKLEHMADVIAQIGDEDGPEVLGVCEVENRKVMQDLIATPKLRDRNYDIVHVNSPDGRGIDVGFFYKKDVFTYLSHRALNVSFADEPTLKTRDILMVKGLLKGDTVYFFVNHWPSRRGGAASDGKRKAAATRARGVIDSILTQSPNAKILLMGDFNDEPTNESIKDVLNASGNEKELKDKQLYNAMWDLKQAGRGSHSYQKEWSMLDQMILSQGFLTKKSKGAQYVKKSANIFDADFMKETNEKYKGQPLRTYVGTKYMGGYSDHFPVYLQLK